LTEVGAISLTEVYCSVLGIEAGTITPTPVFIYFIGINQFKKYVVRICMFEIFKIKNFI
jgi:hypothetical protein